MGRPVSQVRIDSKPKVLHFIARYFDEQGYSPCIREIADSVKTSIPMARTVLKDLKAEGYISFDEQVHRSISVHRRLYLR